MEIQILINHIKAQGLMIEFVDNVDVFSKCIPNEECYFEDLCRGAHASELFNIDCQVDSHLFRRPANLSCSD